MTKEEFYKKLIELNIELTVEQKKQFEDYANLLLEYNKTTNLTAIKTIEEVYLKHFYDSLTIVKIIDLNNCNSLLDIGSGAGFPGIAIKILFPNINVTLLDSNHKKTDFEKYIIEKLLLNNIDVINNRAEEYFKNGKNFDLVVARAVAHLQLLSELCIPFVKDNNYFIAMKGEATSEITDSLYCIEFLGGKVESKINFKLPYENSERTLIKIKKLKETPKGYPRLYDKILKKPLKKNGK